MDKVYMQIALAEAQKAMNEDEVPIGAVLVKDDAILAIAHNEVEKRQDATAHAEIRVLKEASKRLGQWRLTGATLYVTVEPCMMCAGAIIFSRIKRLVYGIGEPKTGAIESILIPMMESNCLNHKIIIKEDVLADEALVLMQSFFKRLRRGTEVWP